MFVFERSFWTVAAGLATALALCALNLILERAPSVPEKPAATAELRAPAETAPIDSPEPHDISLARR
jgi:hypothetical protein